MPHRITTVLAATLSLAPAASAAVARFDSLPEGSVGPTFTTEGITFFDGEFRLPSVPPPAPFCIENASGEPNGPLFSGPNVLKIAIFTPGPQSGHSRFGAFSATLDHQVRTFASVDVFYRNLYPDNTISLQALLGGSVVASDTLVLPGGPAVSASRRFVVSGVEFDTIRLTGGGTADQGIFPGFVDNVRIDFVPAPGAALTLAGAAAAGLARRRR